MNNSLNGRLEQVEQTCVVVTLRQVSYTRLWDQGMHLDRQPAKVYTNGLRQTALPPSTHFFRNPITALWGNNLSFMFGNIINHPKRKLEVWKITETRNWMMNVSM